MPKKSKQPEQILPHVLFSKKLREVCDKFTVIKVSKEFGVHPRTILKWKLNASRVVKVTIEGAYRLMYQLEQNEKQS